MTDLLFSQTPLTVPNLVFGSDAPVVPAGLSMQITVLLDSTVTVSAVAGYDNRVTNWLDQRAAAAHQTALPHSDDAAARWATSIPRREAVAHPWQVAAPFARPAAVGFAVSRQAILHTAAPWQLAQRRAIALSIKAQQAIPNELQRMAAWQATIKSGTQAALALQAGVFHDLPYSPQWTVANVRALGHTGLTGASMQRIGVQGADASWQVAGQAKNGLSILPPVGDPPLVIQFRDGHLLFECPPIKGTPPDLMFGVRACYFPARSGVVPIRKVYMVFNDVSLRRVDGNIALPAGSITLSLDVDSWAWGFSAALPGHVLPDLEPASSGAPVELEAMVNGAAFRVLVESISRERTFGKNDLRVQGRGKTALLDSPYAPTRNFGNTAARTAQQLMGDVLSVNGVPMGWALNWGLTDWLVPANVFAHQGSYINALNAIASAAGGYIRPHASLQSLDALARYPVAPWNWAAEVTPDFELPADVTTREGIEWVERARYNRVFVSGQQSGVLGQVTRTSTAGDLLAPMVTDALITTAAAARQRGISVLGNTGRQANISLRLPVLPETGIITPGKFVRYVDAGVSRLGIVRSVSLDAGFPNVWQSIGVETHV